MIDFTLTPNSLKVTLINEKLLSLRHFTNYFTLNEDVKTYINDNSS